jgi:hypothetical protein
MVSTGSTSKRPFARRVISVVVVAVAIAGTLVAAVAFASGSHGRQHQAAKKTVGLAVFSHQPKGLARIASAGSLKPPPGAILADVVGRTEVYVLHNSSGDDCVMHLTVGAAGGSICSRPALIEKEGAVGIFQEGPGAAAPGSPATLRVTVLVPNGVRNVTFTDRDGSSYKVPVTNNVVEHEDINAASVAFALPGGGNATTNVAAVVDHTPRQPGPADSSRMASH